MKNTDQHTALYNTSRLSNVGKGNIDFVKRMLRVFINQMHTTREQMNAYLHNPDQVYHIIHQAKPSIMDICNTDLIQTCENIERFAKQNYTVEMIEQIQLFSQQIQAVILQIEEQELS